MLKTCALALPALIPSWRFFQTIEASPRIEWTFLDTAREISTRWYPFRPLPETVTPLQMLCRLFWNPAGNEALYVVSCAERIALADCPHATEQITARILRDVAKHPKNTCLKLMQFRLVFVTQKGGNLSSDVVFVSKPVRSR